MGTDALGKLILLPWLRALAWAIGALPGFARRALASALGRLLGALGFRKKVIQENLAYAYPGESPAVLGLRETLFHEAYRHLGSLVLEILLLLGPFRTMRRYVLRNSELRGAEHWRAAKARGKGVIFLSSHVGNWEVMAAAGAIHGSMDLMLVTKHLKPEWLHQAIEKGRASCGVSATYEPKTFRDVLGHLKRNGTVGIVLDQYAGPPVGVRVPVFGVPVGTNTVIAMLARRTGAAVVPVVNYKDEKGRQIVDIQPALEWRPSEDASYELAANTAYYASLLEGHIRAHPDQWLWVHRRFKGDLSPLRPAEWEQGRARS